MTPWIQRIASRVQQLPPMGVFCVGVAYEVGLGLIETQAPRGTSFILLHLLSVVFVAWGAGPWHASALALVASEVILHGEWTRLGLAHGPWLLVWNTASRLTVLIAAAWLTAKATRITRHLAQQARERTAQWEEEARKHAATSARLTETVHRFEEVAAQVAQKISDQMQAERRLADLVELNQKILAASPMGIAAYRESGQCVFANQSLGRIVGGSVEQILSGNYCNLQSWQDSELLSLAQEALRTNQAQSTELHLTTSFGKAIWIDAHIVPFISGGESHLLFLSYDITARQRLERQILEISDREQARIGQDIHDGLCQQLVSLAFDANTLQRKLEARNEPEAAAAQRMARYLDEAITESRQLSRGLFPIRLAAEGLPSALEELAHATAERYHIPCEFRGPTASPVLSKPTATHLYRIAREAINNAVKHGQARLIIIHLENQAKAVELRVQDNGVGLLADGRLKSSGMGLHIMEYRARSIGGTLRLAPAPSGGTIVSCCVPGLGS